MFSRIEDRFSFFGGGEGWANDRDRMFLQGSFDDKLSCVFHELRKK